MRPSPRKRSSPPPDTPKWRAGRPAHARRHHQGIRYVFATQVERWIIGGKPPLCRAWLARVLDAVAFARCRNEAVMAAPAAKQSETPMVCPRQFRRS